MNLAKLIASMCLTFFLVGSNLAASTQGSSSLTQKCKETIAPYLKEFNMSLEDLNNPAKTKKILNKYKKTSHWVKLKSACGPSGLEACDCCNKCGCGNDNSDTQCLGCTNCGFFNCCYWDCCGPCYNGYCGH